MLLFGRPFRMNLFDAAPDHLTSETVRGIGQGDSLRGRLGGKNGSDFAVYDFNARSRHSSVSIQHSSVFYLAGRDFAGARSFAAFG
jgi:hypothetical protein